MSRYSQQTSPGIWVSWGFDHALGYWIDCWNESKDPAEALFEISSFGPNFHPDFPNKKEFNKSEILEIMNRYDFIPGKHKQAVALDLEY